MVRRLPFGVFVVGALALASMLLWPVRTVLHAQVGSCDRTAVINISTATTTEIVALTASRTIVVCGFVAHAGSGLSVVTGTDPAANTEVSETVPANARWQLLSVRVQLVTDATAANREVALQFDDGTTPYFNSSAAANQAASLTRQYTAASAITRGADATGTGIQIALPASELWLPAGHRIRTSTTNRQATDNYGAPTLLVREVTTFKFVTGTGTNCATGQADASGPYELEPSMTMPIHGPFAIVRSAVGAALCVTNNRATRLSGTLSYGIV